MKNFFKYKNLSKLLKNDYSFLCYDINNINFSIINFIKNKLNIKIIYFNKKTFNYFNLNFKKNFYLIILKNNCLKIQEIIIFIFNFLKKKPFYIFYKNIIINKIPILKISKLSKQNLIFEIVNFLKIKILNFIKLLKIYAKNIS